jgi:drug/metabolite transporter (DMT)-like permease
MLAAMMVLPMQDGVVKLLSETLPVPMVVWARYLFHLLLLLPLLWWRLAPAERVPRKPGLQLLRATTMLASGLLFFLALAQLPLVDTLALFFISPLMVTLLAPLVLKERVGWVRRVAAVIGFLGVLIVLRPGSVAYGPYALLALSSGVANALYLMVTRQLAGAAAPLATMTFGTLFGTLVLSAWVLPRWTTPSEPEWLWMVTLGTLAMIGHYLAVKAFDFAPASTLAPLTYASVASATMVGYLFFSELPDAITWVGIAVIVASGVVVSLRERRAALGVG